jgi:hypothetical protein
MQRDPLGVQTVMKARPNLDFRNLSVTDYYKLKMGKELDRDPILQVAVYDGVADMTEANQPGLRSR